MYNELYVVGEDANNPATGIVMTPFDIDIISSKTSMTGGFYKKFQAGA